jgi:hypothetical protein
MTRWTLEKLRSLMLKQREALFDNARAQESTEARSVIALLIDNDLLVREGGGLPREHPTIQHMEEVIKSDEGHAKALEAAAQGLAAMAVIDPLLQAALGTAYGRHDTTSWAGTLTAEIMVEAGFVQTRKAPLPRDCIARTAAFFESCKRP